MARFSFSITGRKKQVVEPAAHLPPMSKAHKILGSTPLSIDAPAGWDDASSFITSDNRSADIHTGSTLRDDELEDQVVIANRDEAWGEESDIISYPLRLHAVNFPSPAETVHTDATGLLRKSHSSSTIRSWYDKSKLPLSISQQTSSSAMAKGLPQHRPLGLGSLNESTVRTKKKPAELDLSRTRGEDDDSIGNGPHSTLGLDRMLRSPSILSPFSSISSRSRESRRLKKRNTKENLQVPVPETPRSATSGTPRDLPSLYDHYEQMSIRQVMRQSSTPNLKLTEDGRPTLDNVAEGPCEDEEPSGLQPAQFRMTLNVLETPKTAARMKTDWQLSPGDTARSVSSRHTKTSKGTERSLEGRDLLQTSVLVLSSDSEDSGDDDAMEELLQAAGHRPISVSSTRQSDAEMVLPFAESRDRTNEPVKHDTIGTDHTSRQEKRTSFAASNTYITIPSLNCGRASPGSISSQSATFSADTSRPLASSRSSVMSSDSVASAATWQDDPGFDIREARAITVLPARQPSGVEIEAKNPTASSILGRAPRSSGMHRASSGNQLTPPLSPASVDFYIRSAHSSIDGSGAHSRLMAVTHEEEMLLSALRHTQQARLQAVASKLPEDTVHEEPIEQDLGECHGCADFGTDEISAKVHQSKGSQTTITGATFEFEFPTPPSHRESVVSQDNRPADIRKLSVPPIRTSGFGPRGAIVPSSPSGPPPTMSLPDLPRARKSIRHSSSHETVSTPSRQDVPQLLDDADPSPDMDDIRDWESATSPVVESRNSDFFSTVPWHEDNQRQRSGKPSSRSTKEESSAFLHPHSSSRSNMRKQEPTAKTAEEDVLRPDSPISPESFPSVPTRRTTRTNMARLSAVGPGFLNNVGELGWWGDDD